MLFRSFGHLLAALCISTSAKAQSGWAYVPTSLETHTFGLVDAPYDPTECAISFIGKIASSIVPPSEPRRVISVELPENPKRGADAMPPKVTELGIIPENAHWPDASGKIVAVLQKLGETSINSNIRNPWEVRTHIKPTGNEIQFLYGGIIKGGDIGPIAIVNGRVVRTGDTLGKFSVERILDAGLILECGGSFLVLPRGRPITVTIVGG